MTGIDYRIEYLPGPDLSPGCLIEWGDYIFVTVYEDKENDALVIENEHGNWFWCLRSHIEKMLTNQWIVVGG